MGPGTNSFASIAPPVMPTTGASSMMVTPLRTTVRWRLARGLLGGDLRHDAAVVGGHVVLVHGLAVAVKHLALVATAKVHARVGVFRHAHIVLEVEVVEVGALRHKVCATARPGAIGLEAEFVGKNSVLELPAVLGRVVHKLPAVEAIREEVDWLAKFRVLRRRGLDDGIAPALDRRLRRAVILDSRRDERVAIDGAFELEAPRMVKRDLVAGEDDVVHRDRRRPTPKDNGLSRAVRIARDDHMAGVHAVVAELETPVADDRILGIDAEIACAAPSEGKPRRQRR